MTTRAEISGWFDEGVPQGATHMAVLCDSFSYEDYPVYITASDGEEAKRLIAAKGGSMQRLMEVYHLGSDKAFQLAEHRAHNYELIPGLVQLAHALTEKP